MKVYDSGIRCPVSKKTAEVVYCSHCGAEHDIRLKHEATRHDDFMWGWRWRFEENGGLVKEEAP